MSANGDHPGYLRVRNWERFQHYKDRNPIWVKFYVELLDDMQIRALPLPTRFLLDQLLLLAARQNNAIVKNSEAIANLIGMEVEQVREGIEQLLQIKWLSQTNTPRRASKRASKLLAKSLPRERERERNPPTPLTGFKPQTVNGDRRMPMPIAETWQRFLNGYGWDETFNEEMILDELRRHRESVHSEGAISDGDALEMWRTVAAQRGYEEAAA